MGWARHNWFLMGMILACLLGYAVPETASWFRGWTPLMVALILFLVGLGQPFTALWLSLLNWSAVGLTLAFNFVGAPLLAWAVGRAFYSADDQLYWGLILLSAVPTTMASSVVWTRLANGNTALSVVLVLASTAASIVVLPLIIKVFLAQGVDLPVPQMMVTLLLTVALPVTLAQIGLACLPALKELASYSGNLGQVLILVLVLTAVADAAPHLAGGLVLEVAGTVFLLHLLLAVCVLISTRWTGFLPADRPAVFFASSQKTITVALLIGLSYFSGLAALASIFYHVIQNFGSFFWVKLLRGETNPIA